MSNDPVGEPLQGSRQLLAQLVVKPGQRHRGAGALGARWHRSRNVLLLASIEDEFAFLRAPVLGAEIAVNIDFVERLQPKEAAVPFPSAVRLVPTLGCEKRFRILIIEADPGIRNGKTNRSCDSFMEHIRQTLYLDRD